MTQKNINIDIIGSQNEIIESESKIIGSIPHISIRTHQKSVESYFEHSKAPTDVDIIIINLSDSALRELKVVESADTHDKSIILVGDKNNIELLSAAISVGVTEFINRENYPEEILRVANKAILNKTIRHHHQKTRKLNVVLNAKGGSGASFIASNIAYKLSKFNEQEVALLDMDLQFGSVGLNFDINPKYTIVDALSEIDEMDYLSLDAYLCKYNEHLKLLLPSSEEIVLPGEIRPESVKSLLFMLQNKYNQIVIDLPRIIDPVFTMILEQADHISIVVQQTLAQYRDGRRLINVLNKDLDIPLEKIVVIINRYNSKSSLKRSDMVKVVNHENVFTIANDYVKVASASNLGEPLCQSSPKAKIAKDLRELAIFLGGIEPKKKSSGLFGLFKTIF